MFSLKSGSKLFINSLLVINFGPFIGSNGPFAPKSYSPIQTRMHSSRMRPVHCSNHRGGGVFTRGVSAQGVSGHGGFLLGGVCLGGRLPGGVSAQGVSATPPL